MSIDSIASEILVLNRSPRLDHTGLDVVEEAQYFNVPMGTHIYE